MREVEAIIMSNQWETTNDIMYDVAKRARELCDKKMDDLRLVISSDPYGRPGPTRAEFLGFSKGILVETILTEEFIEEFPMAIETQSERKENDNG